MGRGRAHEYPGGAASQKNEQKTGDQFPFQGTVHCATSSWMAESAMANSLPAVIMSPFPLNSKYAPALAKTITAVATNATRRKSVPNRAPFPFRRESATTRVS